MVFYYCFFIRNSYERVCNFQNLVDTEIEQFIIFLYKGVNIYPANIGII